MNETRPSKKQRELLTFIEQFIAQHGYGPSYREIMRGIGYKSVSTVAIHVNNLITKGLIRKRNRSARSIEVINPTIKQTPQIDSVMPGQEKWLVERINQRFHVAERQAHRLEQKILDELYVLVGALHILGLDDAARASKSRLIALREKVESN